MRLIHARHSLAHAWRSPAHGAAHLVRRGTCLVPPSTSLAQPSTCLIGEIEAEEEKRRMSGAAVVHQNVLGSRAAAPGGLLTAHISNHMARHMSNRMA